MSAKHTPGPWVPSVQGYQVLTGDSWETICVLHENVGGIWKDHRLAEWEDGRRANDIEANARLIASAPELLDALKGLLDWEPRQQDHGERLAYEAARAAIAKAEGGR